jgi:hypothetical protein
MSKYEMDNRCDGDCGHHAGIVKAVNVRHPTHMQFDCDFNYCQAAIDEDRKWGFIVTELTSEEL